VGDQPAFAAIHLLVAIEDRQDLVLLDGVERDGHSGDTKRGQAFEPRSEATRFCDGCDAELSGLASAA
jgi:hypothetical protein